MDPITHTLIAVGSLFGAYYLGRFLRKIEGRDIDDIVSALLDKLERDGFIVVKEDKDSGEKELIPISEIIVKTLKEAKKEW
jgi:DNA-binding PadR family transcriptional regulator